MKCPIDKTEMEKGYANFGMSWKKSATGIIGKFLDRKVDIFAYKCPKCGKVELTTEIK